MPGSIASTSMNNSLALEVRQQPVVAPARGALAGAAPVIDEDAPAHRFSPFVRSTIAAGVLSNAPNLHPAARSAGRTIFRSCLGVAAARGRRSGLLSAALDAIYWAHAQQPSPNRTSRPRRPLRERGRDLRPSACLRDHGQRARLRR